MKKRKGSITLAFLLLIITCLAFFMVIFDFSRMTNAEKDLSIDIKNSVDCGLAEYDEELFENYGIMAFPKDEKTSSAIRSAIDYSISKKSESWDTRGYRLQNLNIDFGNDLIDKDVIKLSILKRHKKVFIAKGMTSWMEKFEILKDLPTYANAMSEYSKIIRDIGRLKIAYDKIIIELKDLLNLSEIVKNIDISKTIKEINVLKISLENLKEDYQQMATELANLENAIFMTPEGESETHKGDLEKIASLKIKLSETKDDIEEQDDALKDFQMKINMVSDVCKSTVNFSTSLRRFSIGVSSVTEDIRDRIASFEDSPSIKRVVEMSMGILKTLEKGADKLSNLSLTISEKAEYARKISDKIDRCLSLETIPQDNPSFSKIKIDDFSDAEELKNLFGEVIEDAINASLRKFVSDVWDAVSGKMLPSFSGLTPIDKSEFKNLPSSRVSLGFKQKKESGRKPILSISIANDSMNRMGDSADNFKNAKDLNSVSKIFDKLVIADYTINTFSHYEYENPKKETLLGGAEVEYILSGNPDPSINLYITQAKIFGTRMILNGISILSHKGDEISEISTYLSSWAGFLAYPIVYGVTSVAWISLESIVDVKDVNEGKEVIILKGDEDIKVSIRKEDILDIKNSANKEDGNSDAGKIKMKYKDFLNLFLILESEDETLIRIADLISLKEGIDPEKYATSISTKATFFIPNFFGKARKMFSDTANKVGKTIELSTFRGY